MTQEETTVLRYSSEGLHPLGKKMLDCWQMVLSKDYRHKESEFKKLPYHEEANNDRLLYRPQTDRNYGEFQCITQHYDINSLLSRLHHGGELVEKNVVINGREFHVKKEITHNEESGRKRWTLYFKLKGSRQRLSLASVAFSSLTQPKGQITLRISQFPELQKEDIEAIANLLFSNKLIFIPLKQSEVNRND